MAELEKVTQPAAAAATNEVQIRDLNADDLFKLSEIMEKVSGTAAEKIAQTSAENMSDRTMGFTIMLSVIKHIPTEIKEFIAHVTDQTPEELAKKPFSYPIKAFKQLWKNADFQDFLQEAKSMIQEILPKR